MPLTGLPIASTDCCSAWLPSGEPSPGYTTTGVPMGAQSKSVVTAASGRWMQPWLAKGPNCDPGPSVAAGCQLASCSPSPFLVNQTTIWTTVSGYHSGDPLGQGDCIVQGASLPSTRIAPISVASAGRPVVTGVSTTTRPSS